MSVIKNVVEESHLKSRGQTLIESLRVSDSLKNKLITATSVLSGVALAGAWASVGAMGTFASVKGLLLAAGFVNPVALITVGVIAAGAEVTATVVGGGKLAYMLSKDAATPESQKLASELLDVVRRRDDALIRNNQSAIIKTTDKMQKIAGKLRDVTARDFERGDIDRKVYKNYMTLSKKGALGRLSTIV